MQHFALALLIAAVPSGSTRRVGPLTAFSTGDIYAPWSCKGPGGLEATRGLQWGPRIESDKTAEDGPWALDALSLGLPCSFAIAPDRKNSVVLLQTGRSSYYVLFFKGDRLVKAQRIHGPWALLVKPVAFPPVLEQRAAGDAGFLYEYDAKARVYREKEYPYPPGYDED